MSIPHTELDQLYAELSSFGPQGLIPMAERLQKKLPHLTEQQRQEIQQTIANISETVWNIAERGGEAKLPKSEIINTLQKKHPFLQEKGLSQALFLINYYVWHEGYDK